MLTKGSKFIVTAWQRYDGITISEYFELNRSNHYKIAQIFKEVLYAIYHMHMWNVSHRDLNDNNVMCNENNDDSMEVMIIDYGYSTNILNNKKTSKVGVTYY